LAERREVDVVLEGHGKAERGLELVAEAPSLEARDVLGELHGAVIGDDARDTDNDRVDERWVERSYLRERVAQASERVRRALDVGDRQLDGGSGRDRPAEIADGAADEAGAEVEPEHECGLGYGLEVDGPVARSIRPALGLADEPRVQQ